jgi:multiple sugar transport system permease protein
MVHPQKLARGLLAALVGLLLLAPFAWMLVGSLRTPGAAIPLSPLSWPQAPSLEAYQRVFVWVPMASGLVNSALLTLLGVLLSVASASFTGFAMTRLSAERQLRAVALLVVAASIPLTAIWVPRFVLFEWLGLSRSVLPLLAPALYGASPLFVLLYFVAMRRLGSEQFDAARLDGLSLPAQWWRIALPQLRPTTVAVATLAAMQFWGGFLEPLLYLESERELTAPLLLHALDLLGPTQWAVLMAGAALLTLPVLLVFVASQGLFRSLDHRPEN